MRGWEAIDEETNTGTWWAELKERIRTGPFSFLITMLLSHVVFTPQIHFVQIVFCFFVDNLPENK